MKKPYSNSDTPQHDVESTDDDNTDITRRRFIRTAAGAAALGLSAPKLADAGLFNFKRPTPRPGKRIEHVVVVMMENRSFDHMLGWVPGADGRQAGLMYSDRNGTQHPTYPLAPDYMGCGHPDPDHSYEGGRVQYNGGAVDGWLRSGANDEYAIGYYTREDLAFYAAATQAWTTCDRYFTAIMASTYPNKIYQYAAQTDRLGNSTHLCTLPTIWDSLAARGVKARYYFSDLPFLSLWGTKYKSITRSILQFYLDCALGRLPAVSFIDPRYIGAEFGLTNDDHPHADVRNGQAFLNDIYNAVTSSPNWANTVLVINYDEWGGFYDHVPPPFAPIPPADLVACNNDGLLGFRVPCLVISPWAQRGVVAHGQYDHTSILKMIEDRWNLPRLTVRDATANSLAEVLDFNRPNVHAPRFSVPGESYERVCPLPEILTLDDLLGNEWKDLHAQARSLGFI